MNLRTLSCLLLAAAILAAAVNSAHAQDNVRGGAEPIVASIDPSKLTYDILVDGNLPADDPAAMKFKTLQAAYAAAPEGTEQKPTVIGIKPNVYQLPGPMRGQSMLINKNYITFLGLTNNRRSVVLADNRGLMQGSDDDGYMVDVNAIGFTCKNLTLLNYCNCDYEYPGDPSKNLKMRGPTITQAVALQAQGDKHVYENVALLSRLDTTFIQTQRSYFKNVYIEGTDDFIGGGQISYWEDCTVVYPTGRGVCLASGIVFKNTKFEATRGMQFYKGLGRPATLIDCTFPVNTPENYVSWQRAKPTPRNGIYSLTYHIKDISGKPTTIRDGSIGEPTYTYSRELSEKEVQAFNSWNLLRTTAAGQVDDWDPAGAKFKYEAAGNMVYRMTITEGTGANRGGGRRGGGFGFGAPPPSSISIRTGGPGVTLTASTTPARPADPTITWSTKSDLVSLSQATGPSVVVTARNMTSEAQWVPINATAANGFFVTAWVYAEPAYVDPPAVTSAPKLTAPANGSISVNYALDLKGREDQSLISWSICDDANGTNERPVAVSRNNQPLKSLPLTPGYIGKFIKASIAPKHQISEAGTAVSAISASPIPASDITTTGVSPSFRNFVATPNETIANGLWTVTGTWTVLADESYENGYGIRAGSQGYLLYQKDGDTGDMQVDMLMATEKTEGTGFSVPGSPADAGPRNLHSDILIKYDPRTKNGYSLRFWRTTQSAAACMYQFYKIVDGAGAPLDDKQMLTGVLKPITHMTVKVTGNTITATGSNTVDNQTLSLQSTITPNKFGGAGVYWPGGSTNTISRVAISYPTAGR